VQILIQSPNRYISAHNVHKNINIPQKDQPTIRKKNKIYGSIPGIFSLPLFLFSFWIQFNGIQNLISATSLTRQERRNRSLIPKNITKK
jgi:hypothetical protein